MSNEMEFLVCPECGSEYFLSTKTGNRTVFRVSDSRDTHILTEAEDAVPIDEQAFFCGGCEWEGGVDAVVEPADED